MRFDKVIEFYRFEKGRHDFYRCFKCRSIFTQQQEREHLSDMAEDHGMHIHCTSLRYEPTTPFRHEWLYPRVFIYAAKVLLARVVAPWAEQRRHLRVWALALRLAGNRVTRDE